MRDFLENVDKRLAAEADQQVEAQGDQAIVGAVVFGIGVIATRTSSGLLAYGAELTAGAGMVAAVYAAAADPAVRRTLQDIRSAIRGRAE